MRLKAERIHESGTRSHLLVGTYKVLVNARSRSVRAVWIGRQLRITVPTGFPVKELDRFIENNAARIVALQPRQYFDIGMVIDTPEVDFSICRGFEDKSDVFLTMVEREPRRGKKKNYYIHVSPSVSDEVVSSQEIQESINNLVRWSACDATRRFLIDHARELAYGVGQKPLGWMVEDRRSRLGACSSKGIINLSGRLIFLPQELRDFIVYHELAHLSEMNHSADFHRICNDYCGGREKQFSAGLRRFRFPVF